MIYLKKLTIIPILLATGCSQQATVSHKSTIPTYSTQKATSTISYQKTDYAQLPALTEVILEKPQYTSITLEKPQQHYNAYNNFSSRSSISNEEYYQQESNQVFNEDYYQAKSKEVLSGDYKNNRKLKQFINKMVRKHNFDKHELYAIFSTVKRDAKALRLIGAFKKRRSSTKKHPSALSRSKRHGQWDKYRNNFITQTRINKGVDFWRENEEALNRAYQTYGVDPAYIVGILGVETNFGGYTGKHSVLDSLTSIALEFPRRSQFFSDELENYLLMVRDEKIDAQSIKGSYAGAFGLTQFMPSSFRQYAVDFNNDGHIDLFNTQDAIGSIANYFKGRGKWNKNIPVTMKTYYNKKRFNGLKTGFRTRYSQRKLYRLGMRPSSDFKGYKGKVSLIRLDRKNRDELWWGTNNFHAIARYNPKDHYAMSVHQLGQAIKKRYLGY